MNTYMAFYKGEEHVVEALTSYKAQVKAAEDMGAKHSRDVLVMLMKKDGVEYTHSTAGV